MFFILGNAELDASIAVWECKRFYDYSRPITQIRSLFAGQQIEAWGGPYLGTQKIFGEDWYPYQPLNFITPPFAEYVSGHSTFSAAGAQVLKMFTGSDAFGGSVVIPAGSGRVEPGTVPAADLTLSWATFSDAAAEAGISRRYGGIHFKDGDMEALKIGRKVGQECFKKAQTYFNGTAQ
jgi:hypothetical protein